MRSLSMERGESLRSFDEDDSPRKGSRRGDDSSRDSGSEEDDSHRRTMAGCEKAIYITLAILVPLAVFLLIKRMMPQKTQQEQVASTTYDCDAGLSKWEALWSPDKQQYCCAEKQLGCAGQTTTEEIKPTTFPVPLVWTPCTGGACCTPGQDPPQRCPGNIACGDCGNSAACHCPSLDVKTDSPPCLCTFDVDRTLTGKQGNLQQCPQNKIVPNVKDTAYGGGTLTLSTAGQCLLPSFCVQRNCYVGVVTAGDASGPLSGERKVLLEHFRACKANLVSDAWCGPFVTSGHQENCMNVNISSPLVVGCQDTTKQYAVQRIVQWLELTQKVDIAPEHVWHFDDRADNTQAFKGTGFNARQISCATRDPNGVIGLCGIAMDEMKPDPGIHVCR